MSIVFEMWGRSAMSGKSQNHHGLIVAGNGTPVESRVPLVTPQFAGIDRIEQVKLPQVLLDCPLASAVQPVHRLRGRRPIPPFREIVLFSKTRPVS